MNIFLNKLIYLNMEKFVKLNTIKKDAIVKVYKVIEFDKKMNYRLAELGFVQNEEIKVIKNFKRAKTMLISVRGYVLSLDYFLAENVLVYGVK